MSDATKGLTLDEVMDARCEQKQQIRDAFARIWDFGACAWESKQLPGIVLCSASLHALLSPLTLVVPEPTVWRVKESDLECRRLPSGEVEARWVTDPSRAWGRVHVCWYDRVRVALDEGREPDPSIAERVEADA